MFYQQSILNNMLFQMACTSTISPVVARELASRRQRGLKTLDAFSPISQEQPPVRAGPPQATPRQALTPAQTLFLDKVFAKVSEGGERFTQSQLVAFFGAASTHTSHGMLTRPEPQAGP